MPWTSISPSSSLAQSMARSFVARLNLETSAERALCAELRLDVVHDARRQGANQEALKYAGVLDVHGFVPKLLEGAVRVQHVNYQLHLTTQPGGALYEATIKVCSTTSTPCRR